MLKDNKANEDNANSAEDIEQAIFKSSCTENNTFSGAVVDKTSNVLYNKKSITTSPKENDISIFLGITKSFSSPVSHVNSVKTEKNKDRSKESMELFLKLFANASSKEFSFIMVEIYSMIKKTAKDTMKRNIYFANFLRLKSYEKQLDFVCEDFFIVYERLLFFTDFVSSILCPQMLKIIV